MEDPSKLLFDLDWGGSLEQQIQKWVTEVDSEVSVGYTKEPTGRAVLRSLLGRMMQSNDLLFKSARLQGNPLIDAPTSWRYLMWKYEYDTHRVKKLQSDFRDVLITKVIEVEGKSKIGLITGLPPSVLIQLRREGAMAGLRELIRQGISSIDSASDSTLAEVGEAVVSNLNEAFAKHRKDTSALSSENKKFFGFDVGRWIALGGVTLAILAASLTVLGVHRPEELWKRWRELHEKRDELRRSPTGILFRHRN